MKLLAIIVAVVLLGGCTTTTDQLRSEIASQEAAQAQLQQEVVSISKRADDAVENLKWVITNTQEQVRDGMTQADRARLDADVARLVGKIDDVKAATDEAIAPYVEQIDGITETIAVLTSEQATAEEKEGAVLDSITTAGGLLPYPFNAVALAVLAALGGDRRRKRVESHVHAANEEEYNEVLSGVTSSIKLGTKMNGDKTGIIDFVKVGEFQDAMGIREVVRSVIS